MTVAEVAAVTDGPHGYHVVDPESDVVMLTAKNAKNWFTDRDGADPLALHIHQDNLRSSLEEDDVVLSTRGTVGCCALVTKEVLPANLDQDVARVSGIDRTLLLPTFVAAYLNSEFGQDYMKREASGMVQQGLSLGKVRSIPIPLLPMSFQETVNKTVRESLRLRRSAAAHLAAAEQTLLRALGLENWRPPEPLTYVRRSSEVVAAARFDAEFFTPRTTQLLAKLGSGGLSIRDVAPPRHEDFTGAGGPGEFDYIEIGALRGDGTAGAERLPCAEAPSRAAWLVRPGDVVTSTVRPNRRLSALITPEQSGFVASSGFVVLQPKSVSSEVLLTYLRLPPVCEVMDLHTSASLYPAISETDLLKLPFPKLDAKTCDAVTAAVRAAHAARREAQALLARAQHAVEVAIEQGESAALKLLTQ